MPIVRLRDLYLLVVVAVMMLVMPSPFDMPRRWAATAIAAIAYRLSRGKRRRIEQGVRRIFADSVTEQQNRAIVKASFRQFWQDPFVSPRAATKLDEDAVIGLSHVDEALAKGRGVILWESGQFGGRMAAKRILRDAGLSVCQVHASNHVGGFGTRGPSFLRDKVIDRVFDRQELRFVAEVIRLPPTESVAGRRTLLERLRENRIVCMANDGQFGQKFVSVPFFGRPRRIATGLVTLARASGAAILPMFCVEVSAGESRVIIEPPICSDHEADRDRAAHDVAAQYVALLESYIRRYPGQYRSWEALRPRPAAAPKPAAESRA